MLQSGFSCVLLVECLVMPDGYSELVKKAKKGDKNAFGDLYKLFLNRIYRFVYYLVGDEFLAEDITQNTFLKAWNSLPRFSLHKGTFQSFIYTIARNLVIDNQRKKKEFSLEATTFDSPSGENLEEEFGKNEEIKSVRLALAVLPAFDRQLVVLRYFEELSFSEISSVVGKKEGAIRVRMHRILGTMREDLEGEI